MKAALLPDRGVVNVTGETARTFLQGLLTADLGTVTPDRAAFGALLTPQGKILVDFLLVESPAGDGFLLDCPRALAPTFVDRLNFYKLRAKLSVQNRSDTLGVMAAWDGTARAATGQTYPDPRLPALGSRIILASDQAAQTAAEMGAELVDAQTYEAHRIALGVPRGGLDFAYGDAFPHETDMDQLAGVDFAKGCYVGQEVVSRMRHRANVRNRIVPVALDGFGPEAGTTITAGDKTIGTFGSSAEGRGLAMVRLDRAEEALAAGTPLVAGGVTLRLIKPDWADFAFPGDAKAAE